MKTILEGSKAVARTVALCRPHVIPAYPITPSTHIPEELSKELADYEFIPVEAEFSAMSACIGASAAGARAFTATSSQGLALMHEALHNASGMRLPIVMAVANRALSAPMNIWCDWQDSVSQRDTGWMQFYCKNNQEVVDTMIQSFRLAEKVQFPIMVCMDGFYLTHEISPIDLPVQEEVDGFLPAFKPRFSLDVDDVHSFGTFFPPAHYHDAKRDQQKEMLAVFPHVELVAKEFGEKFGREQFGVLEEYFMKNSQVVFVSMGALAENVELVVDSLREKGEHVGLLRVKCFRPFPSVQFARALENARAVVVLEKDFSPGLEGALATEVKAALQDARERPSVLSVVCGLGGRDVTLKEIESVFERAKGGETGPTWL
ncbi:MAG: pyruvate ferredoxin oxidoreductase [Candidatus Micrarchaeia archaeon]